MPEAFTPVLTVKLPDKFDDKYANLFYYNSKLNEMEFISFGMIENGAAKLAFNHASYCGIIIIAIIGTGIFAVRKRRQK